MMRESKPICQKWTTRREKKEMLVVRREEFADENQSYRIAPCNRPVIVVVDSSKDSHYEFARFCAHLVA